MLMKKKITFFIMCLMALLGVTRAQETITIGEGDASTNAYPIYAYYEYNVSQQIYTSEEMNGLSGTITKLEFKNKPGTNKNTRSDMSVYMLNTDMSEFESKVFVNMTEATLVYGGEVVLDESKEWTSITLTTPFEYDATKNLLLCVVDNSGTCSSSPKTANNFLIYNDPDLKNRVLYQCNYMNKYDPNGLSSLSSPTRTYKKNQIQITIESDGTSNSTPAPKNVTASNDKIFVGDMTTISWDAVENNNTLYGYNIYINDGNTESEYGGEYKLNYTIIEKTRTSYDIATLQYNVGHGHVITVKAVYYIEEENKYVESENNKSVTVHVSGMGNLSGIVYEPDGTTPMAEATVTLTGKDEHETDRSYEYVTTAEGAFGEDDMYAGTYTLKVVKDNYQEYSEEVTVAYNKTNTVNVTMEYTYAPVVKVEAESDDNTSNIRWAWTDVESKTEDFESGVLSNEWSTDAGYNPWTITNEHKYEGTYSMKSGGKGVNINGGTWSNISITVNVPIDNAVMSFYHKISSEENWDKGFFYIDDNPNSNDDHKVMISGDKDWAYVEFPVSKGYHTYKWSYYKDASGNKGDDTYYVDNITFYKAKAEEGVDSYNVYRKDVSAETEPQLIASSVSAETCLDETWSEAEDGVYQYGVEALYRDMENLTPYFEEGFEGGEMPNGWMTNIEGTSTYTEYNWEILSSFTCQKNSITTTYYPMNSSYAAFSKSDGIGTTQSISWLYYLITPEITLLDDVTSILSFDYLNPDYYNGTNNIYINTYVNTLTVKVAECPEQGEIDWSSAETLWTSKASQVTWENKEVYLEDYVGKKIKIAFVTNRYYSRCSAIDNVKISKPSLAKSITTWSNEVVKGNTFMTEGSWNETANWSRESLPTENDYVVISANAKVDDKVEAKVKYMQINEGVSLTVDNGGLLAVNDKIVNEDASSLILNDGGQILQTNQDIPATFVMNVSAPTSWEAENNTDGWQFIALPMKDISVSVIDPIYYEYDLFKYDGTQKGLQWVNFKNPEHSDLEQTFQQGSGYLASYEYNTTARFTGNLNHETSFDFSDALSYNADDDYANFHLLGNPFTFDMDITKATFTNMVNGVAIITSDGGYDYSQTTIPVGDGFFVQTTNENPSMYYNHNVSVARRGTESNNSLNITATGNAGKDNVVINFSGKSEGFNKLPNFNDAIATVYVAEDGKNYGIYNCDADVQEVELSFNANKMGNYTISIEPNGKFKTVTLVDRFTGIETNMLVEDYNFTAMSNVNANRFIVRMVNGQQTTDNSHFVYQSGEELILNIQGEVQIVDVLGRVVYNGEAMNDINRINVSSFNSGAYMVRVMNGNEVKVEKIIL